MPEPAATTATVAASTSHGMADRSKMKKKNKLTVQVKGLDTETGTWSVDEKRAVHNRSKFVEFFNEVGKYGRNRKYVFESFNVQEVNTIARMYLDYGFELEEIFAYARRFKKAVAQMGDPDFKEIEGILEIQNVMES